MVKIIKELKPFTVLVFNSRIAFAQAMADLALPDYIQYSQMWEYSKMG